MFQRPLALGAGPIQRYNERVHNAQREARPGESITNVPSPYIRRHKLEKSPS